jgi:hypothetical protein
MNADKWNPDYYRTAPVFEHLHEPATLLARWRRHDWPGLDDYQRLFETHAGRTHNQAGKPLHFVAQDPQPGSFEDGYEARIYLHGEIQTRLHNWHDHFQVLIWTLFPHLKAALNARHYHEATRRLRITPQQTNRGNVENALTLFDECGVIIAADDIGLLQLVRDFHWQELFWRRRHRLAQRFCCIVFGHALYEKALTPYVGMTGQALLLKTPQAMQMLPPGQRTKWLDQYLAPLFAATAGLTGPQCLTPFPLLGMPGWDSNNTDETYYDNRRYFRPGRQKPAAPIYDLETLRETATG